MFFGKSLGLGRLWCGSEFAVDFVLVGVDQELVEQAVGGLEFDDVISGQILGAELVVETQADAQFNGDSGGHKLSSPRLCEEMADQWGGKPMGELKFFIAWKIMEKMDFAL